MLFLCIEHAHQGYFDVFSRGIMGGLGRKNAYFHRFWSTESIVEKRKVLIINNRGISLHTQSYKI